MRIPVHEIRLIGGGAKSNLWTQIVSDVFDRPIVRPAGCDASFGAALLAGVGVGIFTDAADAARQCVHIRDVVEPDPEAVQVYAKLFPFYCRIHDDLARMYAELAESLDGIQQNRAESSKSSMTANDGSRTSDVVPSCPQTFEK
jgi:xylulokinase